MGFAHINEDRYVVAYLGKLSAKARYYYERHKKRWERRYKKPSFECNGEFGTFSGVNWINA